MAILLEFNYGKKLGLPGYSSHNFGVSMKAEVNNLGLLLGFILCT